jgi:hypothetical protein
MIAMPPLNAPFMKAMRPGEVEEGCCRAEFHNDTHWMWVLSLHNTPHAPRVCPNLGRKGSTDIRQSRRRSHVRAYCVIAKSAALEKTEGQARAGL